MWPHFAPESLFTINNMKWLKKWNVHYNDLRQWEKKARESEAKWETLERGANRRERKCSHQGEYLLIHLRRGKIIDSECMIVGRGGGGFCGIKNTPTTTASPPPPLLHSIKARCYNMHQNCSKKSFLCYSRRVKTQSFELEGCVLARDDLFIA